jgi:hypothetical protein
MDARQDLLITVSTDESSDGWGFVGSVLVGRCEAYRTVRAYAAPSDALEATRSILASALGSLLTGQEWRLTQEEVGHAPRRTDLEFAPSPH